MKGRTVSGFRVALVCTALGVACAAEEGNDFNQPVTGTGGSAGKSSGGAGGASGGSAGNSSGGKGGSAGNASGGKGGSAGNASGGQGGTGSSGGTGGGGTGGGGTGGSGVAGDCSGLSAEGGATSEIAESLHVELKMGAADNQPSGFFQIVNGTDSTVSLPGLKVRYFFVSEFDCETTLEYEPHIEAYQLHDPFIDAGSANVVVEVVAVADHGEGCDAYYEVTFMAPESLASGQYARFEIWSKPPNYTTTTDPSNDASYGACSTDVVPWPGVPLYQDDVLIWGDAPYEGGEGGEGAGGSGAGGEPGSPLGGQGGA